MRRERSPGTVIARTTLRRGSRSALVWGYLFGLTVASSALSYARIYKTPAERERLAASFGTNHAASALFGPAPQLQTVAGFTVFKVSMTLIVVGAIWGLLTSTRFLRGEEDAGRWELLLSGKTGRRGAAFQAVAGLSGAAAIVWLVTALVTVIVGRSSSVGIGVGAGSYFALALVSSAVMFLAVGALTSQLAPSRRQAAGYAASFLGLGYALRMVADAGVGANWLLWVSPIGWVEQLRPLTAPRPWALAPILGFSAVCAGLAVVLAGTRDLGSSILMDRASGAQHPRLLFGPTGLTLRLTRSSIIWWTFSIAVSGLLMGIVAKSAGTTISGSSVEQVFSRLGAPGTGAQTFLGVVFLILAVLTGFEAAGQVTSARAEEAEGRLDHLLVLPVSRMRWLWGRLAVAATALLVGGFAAGVLSWTGAATQGSGVGFATVLEAGINVVPPAILILGAGVLAIGWWPRRSPAVVYSLLVWSLLVDLVGGLVAENHWLLDTSVFHQMASAPAVAPHWATNAVIFGLGLGGMIAGAIGFTRRDLQSE